MASLKKPNQCPCGNSQMRRERDPERWVCDLCNTVIVSRSKKPQPGLCRRCGASRETVEFKHGKNLCVPCGRIVHKEWSAKNRDKLRARHKTPEARVRRGIAVKKAIQRSPEGWIRHLLASTKRSAKNKTKRNEAIRIIEIDFDFLMNLYETQQGFCALSGMVMEHKLGSLRAISIDRIDSGNGYVPGNVQLVCQWVNHAKRHHSNDEMLEMLETYYNDRLEREGRYP